MISFRYFAALIYDVLILLSLFLGFTAICLLFRQGNAIDSGTIWYQLSLLAILYIYYAASYKYGGQTIGMQAWQIKLYSLHTLSHKHILKRLLLFIPAWFVTLFYMRPPDIILLQWTKTKISGKRP